MSKTARDRWHDALAVAALTLTILAFFWKIAFTNRILTGLDVFAYFYPYRDFVSEALRQGRLPLWNPHLFMGVPLLANSQAAVLYPLHWPLIWLSAPKQVAWSIVLHVWLAALGAYVFARRATGLQTTAAWAAAAAFGLGGFLGAQVEHLNQLNASAWFPWLLVCLDETLKAERIRLLPLLGGGAVAALVLLAGHTQIAYIALFGAGIYVLIRGFGPSRIKNWLVGLGSLVVMAFCGVLLSAGQLLPTLELSRLSVRSGGLPYREAVSFSLKPDLIHKTFLPPLAWDPPFSEYIAYIGLIGLALAAIGIWSTVTVRLDSSARTLPPALHNRRAILTLSLLGIFLAFGAYNPVYYVLYRFFPGFDLFRAPARWLLLYSLGSAVLVGIGLENLPRVKRWQPFVVLLLVAELLLAGRKLAYNRATAPAAFYSMRTAPAHLLAAEDHEPARFLSMSDMGYDPGDLEDLQLLYADRLSTEEIYDLIVTSKMKEVLAYNLPLRYRLDSVDGYDGGLLPLSRYVMLESLFLPEQDIWPDGRLRQQLSAIPPTWLLSLLNAKHIITDKVQDIWIDDVFYDLEHTVTLGRVSLVDLPEFETSHLGIVSYLSNAHDVADGSVVATLVVTASNGITETLALQAGEHTAQSPYQNGTVAHPRAQVGHQRREAGAAYDYVAVLPLAHPGQVAALEIRSLWPDSSEASLRLRGLTLIDRETGTSRSISVDPAYRLVHSGDVKIYKNETVLPRAVVVHKAQVAANDESALALLRAPDFDPQREVILNDGISLPGADAASVVHTSAYNPEEIQLEAWLEAPGYLVLHDTYYPGWTAEVDGQAVPLLRADVYFRAILLDGGQHHVILRFQPRSVRVGLAVALVSWLLWLAGAAIAARHIGRKRPTGV